MYPQSLNIIIPTVIPHNHEIFTVMIAVIVYADIWSFQRDKIDS